MGWADAILARLSGHMSDWDGKNGLLNVGSEWGMSHFMAITGSHWLNGYQKSGAAEPSEFFFGDPVNKQTYLRH
jgi:hypothetical protein